MTRAVMWNKCNILVKEQFDESFYYRFIKNECLTLADLILRRWSSDFDFGGGLVALKRNIIIKLSRAINSLEMLK